MPTLEHNKLLFTDNIAKANILNDHFSSAFVIDDSQSDETPCLEGQSYPCIPTISIFAQGIAQLLQELYPSPVLTLIFNASLVQGKLRHLSFQFTQKDLGLCCPITDPSLSLVFFVNYLNMLFVLL